MTTPVLSLLLVADNPWVYQQVTGALSDSSLELEWIRDPHELGDKLLELQPRMLLIDFQVGSMGGMALTRQARDIVREQGLDEIPVILFLDRVADRFLAKRAGAVSCLMKPFSPQSLQAKIVAILSEMEDEEILEEEPFVESFDDVQTWDEIQAKAEAHTI